MISLFHMKRTVLRITLLKYIFVSFSKQRKNIRDIRDPFRVVLGWAYRGLTGGFLLLQNFCVAISVSPHVCFILVLILISMFLR